jgi:hypothetical protein
LNVIKISVRPKVVSAKNIGLIFGQGPPKPKVKKMIFYCFKIKLKIIKNINPKNVWKYSVGFGMRDLLLLNLVDWVICGQNCWTKHIFKFCGFYMYSKLGTFGPKSGKAPNIQTSE